MLVTDHAAHALRQATVWHTLSVRQKISTDMQFRYARVLAVSAAGGLFVLLWATGVIPYHLRERALKSHLSALSEAEAKALFAAADSFIAREGAGNERFEFRVTDRNRASIPPELLRLKPQTILGSQNSLAFLYDGYGDSETAITIRRDDSWSISAHFGPYDAPSQTFHPRNIK